MRDVFEDTAYVSEEHLSLRDSLCLHTTLTRLTETNVEHLVGPTNKVPAKVEINILHMGYLLRKAISYCLLPLLS